MSEREIPTMEQCIDRGCMCISKDTPKDYHGLSPEYRRKLAARIDELRADYDKRMAEADKAATRFGWQLLALLAFVVAAVVYMVVDVATTKAKEKALCAQGTHWFSSCGPRP
jgi:hypothetical protein